MKTEPLAFDDMILVGEGKDARVVKVGEISMVEVNGNYVTITTGGDEVTNRGSLNNLEKRFPAPPFFRVNREVMVNLAAIERADLARRSIELTMRHGAVVTLSRLQSRALRKQFSL